MSEWQPIERPGYFGRQRDEKVAHFNAKYGVNGWRLAWRVTYDEHRPGTSEGRLVQMGSPPLAYVVNYVPPIGSEIGSVSMDFRTACKVYYEDSYALAFGEHPEWLDHVCSYGECYDNDPSNVRSGLDYMAQESWATHIQDIAVRNVLARFGRKFTGPADRLLRIRGADTEGKAYSPGFVPFLNPKLITQPSMRPRWAQEGSVEDFWQSNKWVEAKMGEWSG